MKILDDNEAEKLWEILKQKDPFTAEHCLRVSKMVEKFGTHSGWNQEDIRCLKIAGLLHDLGKTEIPDEVFEKIRNGKKLTSEETNLVRKHTEYTKYLDEYEEIPPLVMETLKHHHERFDGTGYPCRMEGKNIPEGVRILTIADYYDTIVYQRAWKTPGKQKPLGKSEGIKILIEETHTRLDPDLVALFIRIVLEDEI